jgi:PKD repeat protein
MCFGNLAPQASFNFTPSSPLTSEIITFVDTSVDTDGTIANWSWDFDDGGSSYLQNPIHQYADNGIYNVTLLVTDNEGGTDSYTNQIVVSNRPPLADFSYVPTDPMTLENISFTDLSSDPDGTIINWTWDFDDGNLSYLQHPIHSYSTEGQYNVTLTVVDDDYDTDSTITTLNIVDVTEPNANFSYTPLVPTILETIYFTDTSSDPDGFIVSWSWDFGDGNSSTDQHPTHQYNSDGVYSVTLEVEDNQGYIANLSTVMAVGPYEPVFDIQPGWNLISLPFNMTLPLSDLLFYHQGHFYSWSQAISLDVEGFPLVDQSLFSWDRSLHLYFIATSLAPGYGCWLYSYSASTLYVGSGPEISLNETITELDIGWNLIGVAVNETVYTDDIIVVFNSTEYNWSAATGARSSFNPGYGYWLYSNEVCTLKKGA